MPFYKLAEVQDLINEGKWEYATSRCYENARSLDLNSIGVAEILMALTDGDFRKVWPEVKTDFGPVPADDYLVWYDEEEQKRCRRGGGKGQGFYIKLAINETKTGRQCLLVSFHCEGRFR